MLDFNLLETGLYLLTGAFAGFAAGLLGVGGGLIIVPVLYFIFSTQGYGQQHVMHMALATSLATIIVTSISSTLAHHKKQAVIWRSVFLLSPGLCVGAGLGGNFAAGLDTETLKPIFGIFELAVAALLFSQFQSKRHHSPIHPLKAFFSGSIIGSISALVGVGGGTLTVPFLHWHNVKMKKAIATSAACGLPIAIAATAAYIFKGSTATDLSLSENNLLGYVQLNAFLIIAISTFIFAPLGAKVTHMIPDLVLKRVFALFLLLLGLKMLLT